MAATEEGTAVETAGSADTVESAGTTDSAAPTLRIVRGEPTAEELAALVTVLAMRGAGAGGAAGQANASGWTNRSRYIRAGLWHIADGWRTSAYPQ